MNPLNRISEILVRKDICVLATLGAEGPHTSLMAYLYVPEKRRLYLLTPTESHKFRNLRRQSAISLLIDTRDEAPRDRTAALTVRGEARVVEEVAERHAIFQLLLERHPQLHCFADRTDVAVVEISPRAFQLLEGVENAFYYEVDPQKNSA